MVEKESRLLEMAARQEAAREGTIQRVTRSSASSLSSSLSSLNSSGAGQGRVRRMFEDRRNGYSNHQSPIGWDKSYPLEPVGRNGNNNNNSYGSNAYQQKSGNGPPRGRMKGVVRDRGVSVDRGLKPDTVMSRSRSQVTMQRNHRETDNYSQARAMKPPKPRPAPHHKSTSSLLDSNQNYNGRKSSSSSSYSRDPSPAPSPNHGRFGYRGAPQRGPSPSPASPLRNPNMRQTPPRRANNTNYNNHRNRQNTEDEVDYGRKQSYDHDRVEEWARSDTRRVSENRPRSYENNHDRLNGNQAIRRSSVDQNRSTNGFLSHSSSQDEEYEQENTPPQPRLPQKTSKVSIDSNHI